MLQSAPDPARAFEHFCAALLASMTFKAVYNRRGTEQGRDIDAHMGDLRWFFECKLAREDVDTPSFAYKFLQLDALEPSQRPDFFILLSNGSIKSILKDIVVFKQADKNTTYSVDVWANHTTDRVFDQIVLSESDAALAFFESFLPGQLDAGSAADLRAAGRRHLETHGRFIDQYTCSPLFRRRLLSDQGSEIVQFAHDATVSALQSSEAALWGVHVAFSLIGVPDAGRYGLLSCSPESRRSTANAYRTWGMTPVDHSPASTIMLEEGGFGTHTYTLFTEWGSVATMAEIPLSTPVILPSELFVCVKETALRFRNYLKRGSLLTPCWLYPRIEDMPASAMARMVGGGMERDRLRFQSLERGYLGRVRLREAPDDYLHSSPVSAQPIRVLTPPKDYREIGRAIADSVWQVVSDARQDVVESVTVMEKRLSARRLRVGSVRTWNRLVRVPKGLRLYPRQ